jgi:hypothetical protein
MTRSDFASDAMTRCSSVSSLSRRVGVAIDPSGKANERPGFNRSSGLFVNPLVTNPI